MNFSINVQGSIAAVTKSVTEKLQNPSQSQGPMVPMLAEVPKDGTKIELDAYTKGMLSAVQGVVGASLAELKDAGIEGASVTCHGSITNESGTMININVNPLANFVG